MDKFKNHNVTVTTIFVLVFVSVWSYWEYVCTPQYCSLDLRNFTLRPLLWGSAVWAILFATLLAFPSTVFKKWLYYVASWGLLMTIYAVLSTDPRSDGVLSIDRGQAAWFAGIVMAGASAAFIVGWYILARVRHAAPPAPTSRLIALVISGIVLYYFSVM